MCYVADIAAQFEFVQRTWVNNPDFSQPGTGKDPLIGQPAGATAYQWPTAYGASTRQALPFGDFITLRGGEYFFAPSISMLQSLRPKPAVAATKKLTKPLTHKATPKNGDSALLPESLFQFDPSLLPRVVLLDPLLQLFVPDKADVGAGVVNPAAPA